MDLWSQSSFALCEGTESSKELVQKVAFLPEPEANLYLSHFPVRSQAFANTLRKKIVYVSWFCSEKQRGRYHPQISCVYHAGIFLAGLDMSLLSFPKGFYLSSFREAWNLKFYI